MPRCTCAIDTEAGDQGPYDAKQVPSSGNCLSGKLPDSDSDLDSDKCRSVKTRSLALKRLKELCYSYACDANRARDDSDLTVRRGVRNHFHCLPILFFQYSCLI